MIIIIIIKYSLSVHFFSIKKIKAAHTVRLALVRSHPYRPHIKNRDLVTDPGGDLCYLARKSLISAF